MYRMLQSLEREPSSQIAASGGGGGVAATVDGNKKDDGAASGGDDSGSAADKNSRRSNPHKYLLYRPTFAQLMLYISTAFKVRSRRIGDEILAA